MQAIGQNTVWSSTTMGAEQDRSEQTTEALVEPVVTRLMEMVDEPLRWHESTRSSVGPSFEDSGTTRDHPVRSGNQHLLLHTRVKPGQPWCWPLIRRFVQPRLVYLSSFGAGREPPHTHTHTHTQAHTHWGAGSTRVCLPGWYPVPRLVCSTPRGVVAPRFYTAHFSGIWVLKNIKVYSCIKVVRQSNK